MTRTVRTLVSCALLALVAKPERDLHAQSFNSCVNGSATQETDLTKFELYKMFDDLFLRPDGGRAPTNSTYLIGNALQRVGGTGRYLPAYGKCDPQTDESIMFIRQIIPTGTPIVSGGATGGGGGSAGGTASHDRIADEVGRQTEGASKAVPGCAGGRGQEAPSRHRPGVVVTAFDLVPGVAALPVGACPRCPQHQA